MKNYIIGSDEVGTGSLIHSLVVVGVKAPNDWNLEGLQDSKKLKSNNEKKLYEIRDKLFKLADENIITFSLSEKSHIYIDKVGMAQALKEAYVEVFKKLYQDDCHIISDGILNFAGYGVDNYSIQAIIKADTKIPTVMAASIIGKCYRDEKIKIIDKEYPEYGWGSNCGYSSKFHLEAIRKYGITPYHRMSYAPMKNMQIQNKKQLTFGFE